MTPEPPIYLRERKTNYSLLNLNPMVQADISQLSRECNTWRDALRAFRDEFTQCKSKLQQLASRPLSKDDLTEVEHYHNQFHIQLINIHDLKQSIKNHERKVNFETGAHNGQLNDDTLNDHENLYDQYQSLEHRLLDLREEFSGFSERAQ
jgi:phage terminase small subunit